MCTLCIVREHCVLPAREVGVVMQLPCHPGIARGPAWPFYPAFPKSGICYCTVSKRRNAISTCLSLLLRASGCQRRGFVTPLFAFPRALRFAHIDDAL